MTLQQLQSEAKQGVILEVVKAHTQYADEDLQMSALMEEELGIDSIITASIVEDLNTLFSVQTNVTSQGISTLGELVNRFSEFELNSSGQSRAVDATDKTVVNFEPAEAADDTTMDGLTMRDFVADSSNDIFSKVFKFSPFLKEKTDKGHFWYGMALKSRCENRAIIQDEYTGKDREFLMFASNNYLGLANDPRVSEAICNAVNNYGATNTGCRLIGGTNELHLELERKLAELKGRDDCIVFPSGYSANLGAIAGLMGANDTVVTDVYNHMSIQDGCKLSGAKKRIYQHNDMESLEKVLQRASETSGGALIVADGVFSMHGDIVKLPEMAKLARKYQARILIDDAHSTGVLGATGSGTAEHFNMKSAVDLEVGTMSKALAGMGGFVAGDQEVIDYLRYYANSYVFAATIPAGVAAGLIACLDILKQEPERLEKLWSNIRYLKGKLDDLGFDTEHSESAIIPVVIGDEAKAMDMGRSVRKRGMFCQTVVFPGVAVGDARLRISVLANHTQQDLDEAVDILTESARENNLLDIH